VGGETFCTELSRAGLFLTAAAPFAGCNSKPSLKTPRLGFLATGSHKCRAFLIAGLLQGLRDLGYVEGQTLQIEYRFSDEQDDRFPALADELVGQKVDVILASGRPAIFAASNSRRLRRPWTCSFSGWKGNSGGLSGRLRNGPEPARTPCWCRRIR
jgi:hypothetical protein